MGFLKNISNILKYGFYVIIIGVFFGAGFLTGRKTVKIPKPETVVKYVESEPIHDSIPVPVPQIIVKPIDTADIIRQCIADGVYSELWPQKTEYIEVTKEDTTAIMADWASKKLYKEELFNNDTIGKCTVDAEVQYNRLRLLSYEYIPITKTTENVVYKGKKYAPFVGAGVVAGLGVPDIMYEVDGGMFFNDKYGVQVKYQYGSERKANYLGGSFIYKF